MLKLVLKKLGLKRLELYAGKLARTVLRGRKKWQHFFCYPTLMLVLLGMVIVTSIPITAKAHEVNDTKVVERKLLQSMKETRPTNALSNTPSNRQLNWFKNITSQGKVKARSAIMQTLQELDSYNQGDETAVDIGDLTNNGKILEKLPIKRATLKIFVSSSMPKNLLKAYHAKAIKYGGTLVFKGLPGGSFKELANLVLSIAGKGETGSMQIDDEAFDRFAVKSVPSILLIKEQDYLSRCVGEQLCKITDNQVIYDKITGSIGVRAALEKFVASGDLSQEAKRLLEND